eukprot:gene2235-2409_t
MTHNILADRYTSFKTFPKKTFYTQRIKNSPDVICLQELENDAYDEFYSKELTELYNSEYSIRFSMRPWEDSTTNSKWEGVGIFFKKREI